MSRARNCLDDVSELLLGAERYRELILQKAFLAVERAAAAAGPVIEGTLGRCDCPYRLALAPIGERGIKDL
jgi:hypothetical protein